VVQNIECDVQSAGRSCSKYRDFMLRHHAQNISVMLICRNAHNYMICSKAEAFLHVAILNLTTCISYTELRITAGQQTISINCVVSNHCSEVRNDITLFSNISRNPT